MNMLEGKGQEIAKRWANGELPHRIGEDYGMGTYAAKSLIYEYFVNKCLGYSREEMTRILKESFDK